MTSTSNNTNNNSTANLNNRFARIYDKMLQRLDDIESQQKHFFFTEQVFLDNSRDSPQKTQLNRKIMEMIHIAGNIYPNVVKTIDLPAQESYVTYQNMYISIGNINFYQVLNINNDKTEMANSYIVYYNIVMEKIAYIQNKYNHCMTSPNNNDCVIVLNNRNILTVNLKPIINKTYNKITGYEYTNIYDENLPDYLTKYVQYAITLSSLYEPRKSIYNKIMQNIALAPNNTFPVTFSDNIINQIFDIPDLIVPDTVSSMKKSTFLKYKKIEIVIDANGTTKEFDIPFIKPYGYRNYDEVTNIFYTKLCEIIDNTYYHKGYIREYIAVYDVGVCKLCKTRIINGINTEDLKTNAETHKKLDELLEKRIMKHKNTHTDLYKSQVIQYVSRFIDEFEIFNSEIATNNRIFEEMREKITTTLNKQIKLIEKANADFNTVSNELPKPKTFMFTTLNNFVSSSKTKEEEYRENIANKKNSDLTKIITFKKKFEGKINNIQNEMNDILRNAKELYRKSFIIRRIYTDTNTNPRGGKRTTTQSRQTRTKRMHNHTRKHRRNIRQNNRYKSMKSRRNTTNYSK